MKNVLLNTYAFHESWARATMGTLLRPGMKVAVVAFSFNLGDDEATAKSEGHRQDLLPAFAHYGIAPEDICLVNYFQDTQQTARKKIEHSDVLFFTGGWPDHMMTRLKEFRLVRLIQRFDGLIMGCSAGAMIQLGRYHITPDPDYASFSYEQGLGFIKKFFVEVHFCDTQLQMQSIERVRREYHKPVFAVYNDGGLLVDGDEVTMMGHVKYYSV